MALRIVATPKIVPNGGTFPKAVSVAVTCSTEQAKLRYTTNGSTPTLASARYTAPITLAKSAVLKVLAFRRQWQDSAIAKASFTIGAIAPPPPPPPPTWPRIFAVAFSAAFA